MHALVVYESMFGNTRDVAEAIGEALGDARVLPVALADAGAVSSADLVVVGAPTHAFGMSSPRSRLQASAQTKLPGSKLRLEPGAEGPGVREWLTGLTGAHPDHAAAFDTRVRMPDFLGHASRTIGRRLCDLGFALMLPQQSFYVGRDNRLRPGELDRARAWGAELASRMTGAAPPVGGR